MTPDTRALGVDLPGCKNGQVRRAAREACGVGRPWEALEEKHAKRPPALPRGGRGRQPEARTKAVLALHQRRLDYQRRGRGPASCLATLQRRGGVGVKGEAWTRSIFIPEMSTRDGPQALQLNYPKPHPASDPDCKPCIPCMWTPASTLIICPRKPVGMKG